VDATQQQQQNQRQGEASVLIGEYHNSGHVAPPTTAHLDSLIRPSSSTVRDIKGRSKHFSLPLGVLLSPFQSYDALSATNRQQQQQQQQPQQLQLLRRSPIRCKVCNAYVSCYSPIDFASSIWQCVMCGTHAKHEHFSLFVPAQQEVPVDAAMFSLENTTEMRKQYPELTCEVHSGSALLALWNCSKATCASHNGTPVTKSIDTLANRWQTTSIQRHSHCTLHRSKPDRHSSL
jgi:hypothetical protein